MEIYSFLLFETFPPALELLTERMERPVLCFVNFPSLRTPLNFGHFISVDSADTPKGLSWAWD